MANITKEEVIEWLSSKPTKEIADLANALGVKWNLVPSEAEEPTTDGPEGGKQPTVQKEVNPATTDPKGTEEEVIPTPSQGKDETQTTGDNVEEKPDQQASQNESDSQSKTSTTPRTHTPGRNPGPAFEKWVEVNWEDVFENSSHCITAPKKLSDTDNCSKDWFQLATSPTSSSFTRTTGANPPNGTPFGKCDFTNVPTTTPPTPPPPPPPPYVFVECKAKGKASSVNLSARCYALLEAAKVAGHQCWVVICRDYEWKPATPPAGTTATVFQPNHVIIIGPNVLNELIPPPATLPSSHSGTTCCTINEHTTSTTSRPPAVDFKNIDHPVGQGPEELKKNQHPTKVEIYA